MIEQLFLDSSLYYAIILNRSFSFCLNTASVDHLGIIIIIEHLRKRISLTVNQSSCRFILIDMIINRHIKFNMLKTEHSTNMHACRFY